MVAAVSEMSPADHPFLGGMAGTGRCPSIATLNEQIDGLEFVELLGRGGSGWTFLAVQKSLSRKVAVKVLKRTPAGGEDSLARFRREAETLARLNRPGIVTVHDFGVADEYLYLVMEYVAGPTLRQRMLAGAVPAPQALRIVREICLAVQDAHEAGVLHRDIKPENILFVSDAPDARIKVADFGIVYLMSDERVSDLTVTGAVLGTPFYLAPEQNDPRSNLDRRSDVFSIGVVAYELLTGRLPLGRFPPPSSLSSCSRGVDRAVAKALANQPNSRTPDAGRLASELDVASPARLPWLVPAVASLAVALVGAALLLGPRALSGSAVSGEAPRESGSTAPADDAPNPFLAALEESAASKAEAVASTSAEGDDEDDNASNPFLAPAPAPAADEDGEESPTAWRPQVGDRVKAKWGGTWFDAVILEKQGETIFRVHYEGWPDSHDETLPITRIRNREWLD